MAMNQGFYALDLAAETLLVKAENSRTPTGLMTENVMLPADSGQEPCLRSSEPAGNLYFLDHGLNVTCIGWYFLL